MKKIFVIAFALFSLNLWMNLDGESVALITSVEGEVFVIRNNSDVKEKVGLGTELYKNDLLKVSKKSNATVYFMDGNIIILSESEELTLGNDFNESQRNDGTTIRALKDNDVKFKSKNAIDNTPKTQRDLALLTPGSYRGYGVVPVGPSGYIFNVDIEFIWVDSTSKNPTPETRSYTIIIMDSDLKEVYRGELEGKTSIINRAKISGLNFSNGDSPTKYFWDIYVKGQEPKSNSSFELEGVFTLFDQKRANTIAENLEIFKSQYSSKTIDEKTMLLLSGLYLKKQKLYYDATQYFSKLNSISPNEVYPIEEMGYLFSKLGKNSSILVAYYNNLKKHLK